MKLRSRFFLICKHLFLIVTLALISGTLSCGVLDYFLGPGTEKKVTTTSGNLLKESAPFLPSPYRELASILSYALLRETTPHIHRKIKERKAKNGNKNL